MFVLNIFMVVLHGKFTWRKLSNALLDLSEYPVEFLLTERFPRWISSIEEGLCSLIIMNEGARVGEDVILRLLWHLGKLVHVFTASMVLLVLRVLDSPSQAVAQRF